MCQTPAVSLYDTGCMSLLHDVERVGDAVLGQRCANNACWLLESLPTCLHACVPVCLWCTRRDRRTRPNRARENALACASKRLEAQPATPTSDLLLHPDLVLSRSGHASDIAGVLSRRSWCLGCGSSLQRSMIPNACQPCDSRENAAERRNPAQDHTYAVQGREEGGTSGRQAGRMRALHAYGTSRMLQVLGT